MLGREQGARNRLTHVTYLQLERRKNFLCAIAQYWDYRQLCIMHFFLFVLNLFTDNAGDGTQGFTNIGPVFYHRTTTSVLYYIFQKAIRRDFRYFDLNTSMSNPSIIWSKIKAFQVCGCSSVDQHAQSPQLRFNPSTAQMAVIGHVSSPSTQKVEVGESEAQIHPIAMSQFEANLGHRHHLKTNQPTKQQQQHGKIK